VQKDASIMDLFQEDMELLLGNNYQLHVVNLPNSHIILAHGNTILKRKCNYVLSIIIDSTNKNNKILMEAMKKINVMQLDGYNHTFKEHLQFFKARNKKVNRMSKNLVTTLSNLSTAMCHAFITNQTFMPPPIALPKSSNEKEEMDAK
jgi:hypothetical protein